MNSGSKTYATANMPMKKAIAGNPIAQKNVQMPMMMKNELYLTCYSLDQLKTKP
jgi:hypothetical protein